VELHDAEQLAIRLMKEFGLASTWRFEFDNARRRFGCCHRSQNLISLSRILVEKNAQSEVEDTIRHEIAHALCPPREGHGEVWKAMCRKVGARPVRCYSSEVVDAPEGDWRATCGLCGKVHYKFRRPTRELWCADKECKRMPVPYIPGADRRLHPARKLVWRHKDAMYPEHVVEIADLKGVNLGASKRAALDAMKEKLRKDQKMQEMKDRIAQLEQELNK
jgi:predicted SprT family Zn-dependent metalloprotease